MWNSAAVCGYNVLEIMFENSNNAQQLILLCELKHLYSALDIYEMCKNDWCMQLFIVLCC